MVTIKTLRRMALSLPNTNEQPHFEKPSFRIGAKIFVSYDEKNQRACIKLSEIDQNVYCLIPGKLFYAVPNAWGKQGWTFVDTTRIDEATLLDALKTAHATVSAKKPAAKKTKK